MHTEDIGNSTKTTWTPCDITIGQVSARLNEFESYIDNEELTIDLSKTNDIDCSGIQLLVFIKKIREEKQLSLSLIKHSGAVIEIVNLLGLEGYFGDPVLITNDEHSSNGGHPI